jgi:HK97 family phage prohead protease/HK97 family phage major capsid protein
MIDPNDYDDEYEFMQDCIDETGDEEQCQWLWDEKSAGGIKHKVRSGKLNGLEFVLSDETPDRVDDIILSNGWELDNFRRNPIALFSHRSDFPIGKWNNLRIENKQLRGNLELAPQGSSDRIDEIRALVEANILQAVSVGFRPLEVRQRKQSEGSVFIKSELVETSLVAVPANPNALAVAKNLKISPETIDLVFAGQGKADGIRRSGFNGGHAKSSSSHRKDRVMGSSGTLAQRIQNLETQINSRRDALQDHTDKIDDSNVSDSDLEINTKLTADIVRLERTREALIDNEKLLAKASGQGDPPPRGRSLVLASGERPASSSMVQTKTKDDEVDLVNMFVKACVTNFYSKTWGSSFDATRARIAEHFPAYNEEKTKAHTNIILRAASAPAMTTVPGWAQELAQQTYTGLMPLLMPKSLLIRLAPRGLSLNFGGAGKIVIPTRSRTPSIAGSFVGEGLAIPVRQGAFTSQTLTPKKMAVITTWTKEMDEHSIPAIEGLLKEAIQQDTTVAIDSVLVDTNPATTIRPAGLLNGVTATTATAGGGINALVGDVTSLISSISTSTYGNVRDLVWLINPTDMFRASMINTNGIFPFMSAISAGTLANIPMIDSSTVPAKTIILIDAADFVVVGGDAPRIDLSDQATLHMEDTNPQELVGSPSTVAAPQRSLFQTDSLGLRMVLPLNWIQRRAGTVAWTQNVTW